jgi:hypothetical protein
MAYAWRLEVVYASVSRLLIIHREGESASDIECRRGGCAAGVREVYPTGELPTRSRHVKQPYIRTPRRARQPQERIVAGQEVNALNTFATLLRVALCTRMVCTIDAILCVVRRELIIFSWQDGETEGAVQRRKDVCDCDEGGGGCREGGWFV